MIEWSSIIEVGAKAAMPKIIDAALGAASKEFSKKTPYKSLSFSKHFDFAFAKCKIMKTVFSGNRGVELLHNYVPPSFEIENQVFDEYEFIDEIWFRKKTALIGPAGSGKSMFLRYFWIACTVEPRGKIPLFIEFRDLNNRDFENVTDFIFHYCCDDTSAKSKELFLEAIREGQFIFILDGLDEIKPQQRRSIEESLHEIFSAENIVLISSRPSATIATSQDLSLCLIKDLDIDKAVSIIEKIDFDDEVKSKFIEGLKGNLFKEHESFASRPLLLTLMLLTFNLYAEIPRKMHLFYDQAFDVLFSRHDALKEVFRREKRCKLQIDRFKYVFSAFCLLTYNDSKFEFSESEMLEYIKKSAKICGDKFDAGDFFEDLLDSVNVMNRDGMKYVFSHRSFQEYFTAYFIIRIEEQKAKAIIAKISERHNDTVLDMIFDMNENFLRDYFLIRISMNFEEKHLTEVDFHFIDM
ncbi:NACHT domain-containing protein [Methylobacterium sp. Leaf123]|uniref:NACHT domain-containing protein n=1 Tax=Methylobacterium sp. Leaf123 TaxID=1736264 RepID=UPI0009EBC28B|nr:NACHT domain-containing protein [Methylobacterium sp. Leaf123]